MGLTYNLLEYGAADALHADYELISVPESAAKLHLLQLSVVSAPDSHGQQGADSCRQLGQQTVTAWLHKHSARTFPLDLNQAN